MHHNDAPSLDPRTDITDLYVFQKPDDPSKSILILNVNPEAPTHANAFDPRASYELKIDTNGDFEADLEGLFLEALDGGFEAEAIVADAGRFDEAREHFERALTRVPEELPWLRAQFLLHLGIVEQRAGRPAAAGRRYHEALRLDPEHPVARIRLGVLMREHGERAAAESEWARALALSQEWNRYQVSEIRTAIEQIPPAEAGPRGRLALAFAVLLERHRASAEAEEQYRLAAALLPEGDPAQREACERARRLAGARSPVSSHPTACGAILPR